jgi:glycosyltransferase involved in cell wall biosynthesis
VSIVSVLKSYLGRSVALLLRRNTNLFWVEKELLPWCPAWLELVLLGRTTKLVVDYDDAWFHRYDRHSLRWVRSLLGNKIDRIMARADLVIAGNDYLAQRARDAGARRVERIPTVVDLSRYPKGMRSECKSEIVVGWMGSPSTAKYLLPLKLVAEKLCAEFDVRFLAVGASPGQLGGTPFETIPWSEDTEVAQLAQFDLGIMPLPDEDWERGKCGYKLIQYMASGLPVVASPVGVNREIVSVGESGFLVSSAEEWYQALKALLSDRGMRNEFGSAGRFKVERCYCLEVTSPMLHEALGSVI